MGQSWLGSWRVPAGPSLWLPFAPHIQVDWGCRQYAGGVPRVPPPDRLEGASTMCLQEADKSEGLPAHQSPAA